MFDFKISPISVLQKNLADFLHIGTGNDFKLRFVIRIILPIPYFRIKT